MLAEMLFMFPGSSGMHLALDEVLVVNRSVMIKQLLTLKSANRGVRKT